MYRIVSCIFFLIIGFTSLGQNHHQKLDSLYNLYTIAKNDTAKLSALNKVSTHMLMKDRQKAILLAREGLVLSKKAGQKPIEIANAIYNFGYLMRYAGKRDSSILFLTKSLREYKRLKDTGKMAYVYTQLGANSVKSGNSSKPIDYFDSAVNCFKIAKDTVPLIKAIGILGSLQSSVGQSESALKNGIEALNLAKLINDSNSIGQELQKVAGMHYRTGNTVIAKEMYYEAIKVNNKTKNKLNQYYAYSNLSNLFKGSQEYDSMIWAAKKSLEFLDTNARPANYATGIATLVLGYIVKKQYRKVIPNLELGLNYAKRKNLIRDIVTFYRLYGYYYREIEDYENSEMYYQKGIKIIDSNGLFFPKKFYYESLSYVYEQMGNFKEAYKYEKLFNEHKDSIYKTEKIKAISEAEAKYFVEKKDLELNLLKRETEIKDRKASRQRLLFSSLIGLILLLVIVSLLTFRSYKLKQRLRIEKFRNKVAADLHDDVGSTLSSIAMYSEVIKNKTKDILPETIPMLDNMTNSSSQLMEAMSDIVWTINPKNNTFESLVNRVREFAGELCEAKDISFVFNQSNDLNQLNLSMDASQNIYLIMKEAINNALKYSKCTELSLDLQKTGKNLFFKIIDNGVGFDTMDPNLGNGMTTMKVRMKEIGGSLDIKSNNMGSIISGVLKV